MPASDPSIRREELSRIIRKRRRREVIAILARFHAGYYQTAEGMVRVHRDARTLIEYDDANTTKEMMNVDD